MCVLSVSLTPRKLQEGRDFHICSHQLSQCLGKNPQVIWMDMPALYKIL